jgi:hypothetical protein
MLEKVFKSSFLRNLPIRLGNKLDRLSEEARSFTIKEVDDVIDKEYRFVPKELRLYAYAFYCNQEDFTLAARQAGDHRGYEELRKEAISVMLKPKILSGGRSYGVGTGFGANVDNCGGAGDSGGYGGGDGCGGGYGGGG